MAEKLKLYVWHDVLCDYTCGVMFALAPSPQKAKELVIEEFKQKIGNDMTDRFQDLSFGGTEPIEYDSEVGFTLYGGG